MTTSHHVVINWIHSLPSNSREHLMRAVLSHKAKVLQVNTFTMNFAGALLSYYSLSDSERKRTNSINQLSLGQGTYLNHMLKPDPFGSLVPQVYICIIIMKTVCIYGINQPSLGQGTHACMHL